ncbi:MAG: tRNA (adenosine(37)-N6)-threonylcarbamoyltransferase complex dimerization subunit type 1 TsaB [Sedimentisphaerales bacterium]
MTTDTANFDNPLILAIETSGRLGSVALAHGDKLLSETSFSGPMRHSAEIFPAITHLLGRFNKKPDQIEHIYISAGPGSFTGLRIAVTLAKTMALANDAKIVAVDTLDCIAANVINLACTPNAERCSLLLPNERLATILDAKRGQFFIAVYESVSQSDLSLRAKRSNLNQLRTKHSKLKTDCPLSTTRYPLIKILPDCLMTPEEFLARFSDKLTALIGEGLVFYKDKFTNPNIRVLDEKFWNPSAANIHRLGWQLALQRQFADPLTLTPNYIRGPDAIVKQR